MNKYLFFIRIFFLVNLFNSSSYLISSIADVDPVNSAIKKADNNRNIIFQNYNIVCNKNINPKLKQLVKKALCEMEIDPEAIEILKFKEDSSLSDIWGLANDEHNVIALDEQRFFQNSFERKLLEFIIYHEIGHIKDKSIQKIKKFRFIYSCLLSNFLMKAKFKYNMNLSTMFGKTYSPLLCFATCWKLIDRKLSWDAEQRANQLAANTLLKTGNVLPLVAFMANLYINAIHKDRRSSLFHPPFTLELSKLKNFLQGQKCSIDEDYIKISEDESQVYYALNYSYEGNEMKAGVTIPITKNLHQENFSDKLISKL